MINFFIEGISIIVLPDIIIRSHKSLSSKYIKNLLSKPPRLIKKSRFIKKQQPTKKSQHIFPSGILLRELSIFLP